jgi:hypothetical protein
MVGASREMVSKVMKDLQVNGYIGRRVHHRAARHEIPAAVGRQLRLRHG